MEKELEKKTRSRSEGSVKKLLQWSKQEVTETADGEKCMDSGHILEGTGDLLMGETYWEQKGTVKAAS